MFYEKEGRMRPFPKKTVPEGTPGQIAENERKYREEQYEFVRAFAEAAAEGKIALTQSVVREAFVFAELIARAQNEVLAYFHRFPLEAFAVPEVCDAIGSFLINSRPDGIIFILTDEPIVVSDESPISKRLGCPRVFTAVVAPGAKQGFEFVVADGTAYWFRHDKPQRNLPRAGVFSFGKSMVGKGITNAFSILKSSVVDAA